MKLSDQLVLINKAKVNVKESQTYKDLCKEWQIDPDIIDYISVCFGDLPVSARTTHGIITLNKSLIEKDLNDLSHYLAHEIDHVFSQCLGEKSTKGSSNSEDYLDNPHEIDAFQTQVKFIAETEDQNEAEKYVEKVLKHHDLSGKDKKEKKEELLSEAVNNFKFSNLKIESAKKPLQLSLDFPEPTISKEDVEKFLAELGDDKVQPWRHKRDHQKLGPVEKSTRLERLKELLDSIKKEAGLLKFDQELYGKIEFNIKNFVSNLDYEYKSDWFKILSEKDLPRWKKTVKEFSKAILNDEIKAEASVKSAGLVKIDPSLIKEIFNWAAGLFSTAVRKTQLEKIKEVNISEIEEENSLLGGISAFDDVLSDTKLLKQDLVERYLLVKETKKYPVLESNKKINQKYFESLLVKFYFQDSEEGTDSVGTFSDETLELYFDPDFIDSVDEFNVALSEILRVIKHELVHYYQTLGEIENKNLSSSPTDKDKYYLNPDEFYTLLQDEITYFNRKFNNLPDPVKKLAALFWVDSAPKKLKQFTDKLNIYQFTTAKYFKILKKKDFERWKKAVKEFMKATNIIE